MVSFSGSIHSVVGALVLDLLYQRYRLIALAVNTAVLLAGLLDWIYSGLGRKTIIDAPEPVRLLLFVIAVVGLIVLDLCAVGKMSFAKSTKIQLMPFLARLFLFVSACLVTDLSYSKILFLPLLLYSYLAVNQYLSYALAVLGVSILLAIGLSDFRGMGLPPPPPPPLSPPNAPAYGAPTRGLLARNGRLLDESMGSLITLGFTLLLARAMSQAIQSQQKLKGLLDSLEASHVKLKQYSTRVADLAATEERNRLARDIHDSLGHHLAAINIQLEKANAYKDRDSKRAYEAVSYAQRTVQDALKDVRESVTSLRQGSEPFLFNKSLTDLTRRMQHSKLRINLNCAGNSSRYSRLKLMTLYRAVQEGLTNVHKHAQASQVKIDIDFDYQQAVLVLSDNGTGFDIAAWRLGGTEQTTKGLLGLQERLTLVGGTLDISRCNQRTTLTICIPRADSQIPLSRLV